MILEPFFSILVQNCCLRDKKHMQTLVSRHPWDEKGVHNWSWPFVGM